MVPVLVPKGNATARSTTIGLVFVVCLLLTELVCRQFNALVLLDNAGINSSTFVLHSTSTSSNCSGIHLHLNTSTRSLFAAPTSHTVMTRRRVEAMYWSRGDYNRNTLLILWHKPIHSFILRISSLDADICCHISA